MDFTDVGCWRSTGISEKAGDPRYQAVSEMYADDYTPKTYHDYGLLRSWTRRKGFPPISMPTRASSVIQFHALFADEGVFYLAAFSYRRE